MDVLKINGEYDDDDWINSDKIWLPIAILSSINYSFHLVFSNLNVIKCLLFSFSEINKKNIICTYIYCRYLDQKIIIHGHRKKGKHMGEDLK